MSELDAAVPWSAVAAVIEPHYPKGIGAGRPPIGLERMLRMYVAQLVLGLSDESIEDAIYDSQSVHGFVGIDLAVEAAPDATTLLKFRRLLEGAELTKELFKAINQRLADKGLLLCYGTIVDATLIAAAPSTKNKEEQCDSATHQSKKGNQWFLGMKAHIGVDAESGLLHSVVGTAGKVADVTQVDQLLHGEEQCVFADAGYTGAEKREAVADKDLGWYIARKRGVITKAKQGGAYRKALEAVERAKASARALGVCQQRCRVH